jgi:hypothetical protein
MVLMTLATAVAAEEPAVPLDLQAELTAKLLKYDRNFAARAAEGQASPVAVVLVVFRPGQSESESVARRLVAELQRLPQLGGVPHQEQLVPWAGAEGLLAEARKRHAAVVYLSTGLESEWQTLGARFEAFDGLTISADVDGVARGAVLGFDLVSGKARMVLNLPQARRQRVEFNPELLRLMKVLP